MQSTSVNMGQALKGIRWLAAFSAIALTTLAAESPTHVNFRLTQESVAVIGMDVEGSQGRRVGRVKDFALDLQNGRITEVFVVSPSGFLGLGQKIVAVPPQALTLDSTSSRALRLNVDKKVFQAAPGFEMSNWDELRQSRHVAQVYRYFGQEPYFAADGQGSASGNTATEPLGHVELSSKLHGFRVENLLHESLGAVNGFLYDLQQGRVYHVVVMTSGSNLDKSVIPAQALRFNASYNALYMDISTQAFKSEPRFKWVGIRGNYRQETYSNTQVAAIDGHNTRQNVQGGIASRYTPLAQGASFADEENTYKIYAAMRADTRLSQNAQEVEVGTVNGRVTLRGNVNTEEGKRIVGEIAAAAGRAENISNLLEVRPLARSTPLTRP